MSRKITLSIPVGVGFGWLLMLTGVLFTFLAGFDREVESFGYSGIGIALLGKQLLNRGLAERIELMVEEHEEREIAAFELGRRTELASVR